MKAGKLEIGVRSQEKRGRRKKEGARRSVFTNMRCSPTMKHGLDLKQLFEIAIALATLIFYNILMISPKIFIAKFGVSIKW